MDAVRRRIRALVKREGTSLAEVSRAIGRNHAYLQQFVRRGTPKALPEDARHALARFFEIDESELRASGAVPAPRETVPAPDAPGGRRVPKTLAARLSVARAESVFETPSAFAAAAGIDRQRYGDMEEGEDTPSLAELDRIARCADKPLDWFIRGELPHEGRADAAVSPLSGEPGAGTPSSPAAARPKKRAVPRT
jgi:transcriptional regulator with XRE-family HTH domain